MHEELERPLLGHKSVACFGGDGIPPCRVRSYVSNTSRKEMVGHVNYYGLWIMDVLAACAKVASANDINR